MRNREKVRTTTRHNTKWPGHLSALKLLHLSSVIVNDNADNITLLKSMSMLVVIRG
jgi:hypothetical protein